MEESTAQHALEPAGIDDSEQVRFHMTPKKGWDRFARGMRCGARNLMNWKGRPPLPAAPSGGSCWLLPTSDEAAVEIARQRQDLQALGWRVLSCDHQLVLQLSDKALLRDFAARRGLGEYLPQPYMSAGEACYPCILKSARGEFGKDCHIVHSPEEVAELAPRGLGEAWVLQELVYGAVEYSTSVLAYGGRLLEAIGIWYKCGSEAFVYPVVEKLGKGVFELPPEQLAVFTSFLRDYDGICNFNYKVRPDGRPCIFELNTRVGGDLCCDAPRDLARALLERLNTLTA